MNAQVIRTPEFAAWASSYRQLHNHSAPLISREMSRREFVWATFGTLAVGAAFGAGVWTPRLALAKQAGTPVPIPKGTPTLGGGFRVFGPASSLNDPPDAEPITINDFNGFIGLAYLSGQVTQTNTTTGEVLTLPFVDSDMRFMKGVYRGTDGQIHQGAFALV